MSKFFHFLAIFSLTFWCGAATMFVVLTVVEILSGQFDSMTLDRLVTTRFPVYYYFTTTLLLTSLISSLVSFLLSRSRKMLVVLILVGLSCSVLVVDYFFVYTPLREMLLPIGKPRPQEFPSYHRTTETLNTAAMLLNLIAAFFLNWPGNKLTTKEKTQS